MERTLKTWGEKWCIFENDLCEVSILELKPMQRCSWHTHQAKGNLFFVWSGELFIKTQDGVANLKDKQIFTTYPGEWHEFQTHDQPCTVIEIMFVKYKSEDIQREKLGGPLILELNSYESTFNNIICNICGMGILKVSEMISIKEDEVICNKCFKQIYKPENKQVDT